MNYQPTPAIGYRVRHLPTGRFATVQTYHDDGDLAVLLVSAPGSPAPKRVYEKWNPQDCESLGRYR